MIIFFCQIALFTAFSGCFTPQPADIDYIVYGVYAGECRGHCATMYKLEKTRLVVDTTDSFFRNMEKGVTFRNDTLKRAEFDKALSVRFHIPLLLLMSNGGKFGNPDAYDQGGIFIQIKSGSKLKSFYIDTELAHIPAELRNYAKLVMRITASHTTYDTSTVR